MTVCSWHFEHYQDHFTDKGSRTVVPVPSSFDSMTRASVWDLAQWTKKVIVELIDQKPVDHNC